MKNDIIHHIGFPKTGSTFLQHDIFPRLENVKLFTPDLNNYYNTPEDNIINLYSSEGAIGNPFTGNTEEAFNRLNILKTKFPNTKIIMICRQKKKEWILSIYNQYVKGGGKLSFKQWFKKIFDINFLNYDIFIQHIQHHFNKTLILDYELLKENHYSFIKEICDFINVPIPKYQNIIRGKSISEKTLTGIRLFNQLNINISKTYRKIYHSLWRKKIR